jgi:hypothetical protein
MIDKAYSITMAKRTPEMLLRLFKDKEVLTLDDIKEALDNASRPTTFRYLRQVSYLRSYNHNGRYYTRKDCALFDRFGLYSRGDIHFSCDGTLGDTVKRLVRESQAGWTQRELQELLRVRVQVLLLEAVRQKEIAREAVGGFYLYVHIDPDIGKRQLHRRRERIAEQPSGKTEIVRLDDSAIIQVLLTLIRHPGSRPGDVVRALRGHSPPIGMAQVVEIFTRYTLDDIGEKGGPTNC